MVRAKKRVFPARSPQIRELTENAWENAVQGLGKSLGTSCNSSLIITHLLKIFSCLFLLRMFTDNIIERVEEKAFGFGNVNESPEGGMKV